MHILLVLITAWICLNKPEKDLVVMRISNVFRGVGNLQMENESVDTVVSMNGFHAFPDKQKAFHEIWRVLKPGGNFIACFYIRGKSKRTDWLVKNILAKKGWFSPPFQTEKELRDILQKLYKETDIHVDGSMVYFRCVK